MEPDHLRVDGARLGRAPSWVVIGVVLAVVIVLAVLRFTSQEPDVSPRLVPRPMISPTPSNDTWPTDLPAGTFFVGSAGRVYVVDGRDGTVTRTEAAAYSSETSMTPLAGGVLVRTGGLARAVVTAGRTVRPGRGALRSGAAFLPGPDRSAWAAGEQRSGRTTWRRVDADGQTSTSVRVDGLAQADGAGGLLSVTDQGFRSVYPPSSRTRQSGDVMATGPDGYVRRTCAQAECRFTLHRHQEEPDLELSTAVGQETTGGTLSPANRRLAVTETVGGTSTLRVSVVGTGQISEIFDQPRGSTSDAVWLDDRWLALISVDRLTLYDAAEDRIVVPDVPLGSLGPLAWLPA